MPYFLAFLVALTVVVCVNIVVVPQSKSYVVQRLGVYYATWEAGLHVKLPVVDKIAKKCSRKEQVFDTPESEAITKDNVHVRLDAVVYFFVFDPERYTYGVEYPMDALENLCATAMRNLVGSLELDGCLTSREEINKKLKEVLDEATDPWGIKVTRVELKNIVPPRDILDAMEKQMRAERERREAILQAEGQKQSQILVAQGEKEAAILRADANRYAVVAAAEAEAEAIRKIQNAKAEAVERMNKAEPCDQVVKIKALEAFEKAADGQATKIIIPTEIASLAGLGTSIKDALV